MIHIEMLLYKRVCRSGISNKIVMVRTKGKIRIAEVPRSANMQIAAEMVGHAISPEGGYCTFCSGFMDLRHDF